MASARVLFPEVVVPVLDRELAGDQHRAQPVTVLDELHEVMALGAGERGDRKVVERQHVGARELSHQPRVRAVAMGDAHFLEQARQPVVARGQPLAASLVAKRTGDVGLRLPPSPARPDVPAP